MNKAGEMGSESRTLVKLALLPVEFLCSSL